MSIENKID